MTAEYKYLRIERHDDAAVIILGNVELFDRLLTDEVRQELLDFVDAEKPAKLVVSFEDVTRCSTEVINGLIRARKRAISHGGEFRLCLVRQEMRQVLRILKLDGTIFDVHDTLAGALKSFS